MIQLVHEDDVVRALAHVTNGDFPGVFNIATTDLMPLSKIMGLVGKPRLPIFHLFAYWGYGMAGGKGLRLTRHVPIELDYIRYRWVGDLKRMREILSFEPIYSSEEILREFAEERRKKGYLPETITRAYDVDRLREIIDQRRVSNYQTNTDEGLEAGDHE